MSVDVAVIGGGLAGLAVADQLQRNGEDFLLLEARDRLGGRVLSIDFEGASFDLGPAWFWPGQPLMRAAIERFGLNIFEQYSLGDAAVENRSGAITRGGGFASMQGSYRIDGGVGRLISAFAASLPASRIKLNAGVSSIENETSGVLITSEDGDTYASIRAKRVILTAPPRVVEATMRFTPQLPARVRQVLRSIPTWMAGQAKVLAVYDRPYWREAGLSGDAISQRGPLVEIHDACAAAGPAALFGFVGFPPEARKHNHDLIMEMAKHQLAKIFGNELLEPRALIFQDWSHDAFTSTSQDHGPNFSHPTYGRVSPRGLWGDRLQFAGTETATQFGGYLEGALQSAETIAFRGRNKRRSKSYA
jgi:monoamine oxidase